MNYLVDGGDNNDDTVGGQLQLFPLDAIDEFRFSTRATAPSHRPRGGGVMNVVTKSGTNRLSGSGFIFFRDDALNARTTTEIGAASEVRLSALAVRRIGGWAHVRDHAHFFGAVERVQQDTFQPVDTLGLFPDARRRVSGSYRETLAR